MEVLKIRFMYNSLLCATEQNTKVFISKRALKNVILTKVLQTQTLARKQDTNNKYGIFVKK
jgi:hypothetical protein